MLPDTATTNSTDITCHGDSNGVVSAQFVGGTSPFTYNWSNAETSQTISNLGPGTFSVTITDAVGCIQEATDSVGEPDSVMVSTLISDSIECHGTNVGDLIASPNGGILPYSFIWNNNQTNDTIASLESGIYTVTLTDANGCTDTSSIYLSQPPLIEIDSIITTHVSCNSLGDGLIETFISGGTAPLGLAWSTGDTTALIDQLSPGDYGLTITDAYLCTIDTSFEITQPDSLIVQTSLIDSAHCNNTFDGAAFAFAQGGSEPYSYLWSNNALTDTISEVAIGSFSVTVTDTNGCTDSSIVDIPFKFQQPLIGLNDSTLFCDTNAGHLTVQPGNNQYQWSSGDNQHTIEVINAGMYTVTVTSFEGCISIDSTDVTFAQSSAFNLGSDTVLCLDENQLTYVIMPSSGSLVSYMWSTGDTTSSVTVNSTSMYYLTATNAVGCTSEDQVLVVFDTCRNVSIAETDMNTKFTIYPNPTRGKIRVVKALNDSEELEMVLRSAKGDLIERKRSDEPEVTFDLSQQSAGVYILSVTSSQMHKQFRIIKE